MTSYYPKDRPARDEDYRRRVAALPCINCNRTGASQAAHGPTLGMGIKGGDYVLFPLCCERGLPSGIPGCHWRFDNYRLGSAEWRREISPVWAKLTREKLGKGESD